MSLCFSCFRFHFSLSQHAIIRVSHRCSNRELLPCSCRYTVLTWKRYTQIERVTRSTVILDSSTAARAERTRRRLFLMTFSILVPYLFVMCVHTGVQMRSTFPLQGLDFHNIRHENRPLPWDTIFLYPSSSLEFFQLNSHYLVILTALPIYFFFGRTENTTKADRRFMDTLGLRKVFSRLREDPAPKRRGRPLGESWHAQTT